MKIGNDLDYVLDLVFKSIGHVDGTSFGSAYPHAGILLISFQQVLTLKRPKTLNLIRLSHVSLSIHAITNEKQSFSFVS